MCGNISAGAAFAKKHMPISAMTYKIVTFETNEPLNLKTMSNAEKVLEAMRTAGKPLKNGEIEKLSGLTKDDVAKAMKELKAAEVIVSPKMCYWEPKK